MLTRLESAIRTIPDFPKPGVQFKDITPILANPELFLEAIELLKTPYSSADVTHVVGMESRGFWFGAALAERLAAGFIPARKLGKLPGPTIQEEYELEYGTDGLEIHSDVLGPGNRVIIHDDVIATGGTAAAASRLVKRTGAEVVGFSFFVDLTFLKGKDKLPEGVPFRAVIEV